MAVSAAKIAFYNFKWQFVTLVLYNTTLLCGVNEFVRSYRKNAVVANELYRPRFSIRIRQFVLFATNLDSIDHLLTWLETRKCDKSAKFLIICQSNETKDCDEAHAIDKLWSRRIVNVIYISNLSNKGMHGYYYEYGDKCKATPPMKVSSWESCVNKNESRYCADKFPVQFRNWHGCPIIVSTFFQPPYMYLKEGVPSGADGDLLKIIIEALNATLVIMTPCKGAGWGNLDENGSWVGSLGDIYYDVANISMTSACVTKSRYSEFHMSTFYHSTSIVWVTHPSNTLPSSYKLLRPFKVNVRIVLVFSFTFVIIVALLLKTNFCTSLYTTMNFGRSPDSVIFLAWKMCMGQAVTILPLKLALVYLILFWIWYCFLIRTFYQVHLINSLKTDVYLPQFSSIEEAIAVNYPFGGGPALKDYFIDDPLIFDNWKDTDSSKYKNLLVNLTKGQKFVLAINLASTQKFLKHPGRKLHILPEQIINSPTTIFLKKFSPFTKAINRVLKRLIEFGWPQKMYTNNTVSGFVDKTSDTEKPIKLIYCTGIYIILSIGWVFSIFLFILEIWVKRKEQR